MKLFLFLGFFFLISYLSSQNTFSFNEELQDFEISISTDDYVVDESRHIYICFPWCKLTGELKNKNISLVHPSTLALGANNNKYYCWAEFFSEDGEKITTNNFYFSSPDLFFEFNYLNNNNSFIFEGVLSDNYGLSIDKSKTYFGIINQGKTFSEDVKNLPTNMNVLSFKAIWFPDEDLHKEVSFRISLEDKNGIERLSEVFLYYFYNQRNLHIESVPGGFIPYWWGDSLERKIYLVDIGGHLAQTFVTNSGEICSFELKIIPAVYFVFIDGESVGKIKKL